MAAVDFATSLSANTTAKLIGHGLIHYTKAHTTKGRMKMGWEEATIAIDTLENRQKYLAAPDLKRFAERLAVLDVERKELLKKSRQAKWPWTHITAAKEFVNVAVELKETVISTSQTALLKHLASDEVNDDEYTDYMRKSLKEVIRRILQEDTLATIQSVHNDESAIDNNPFTDPATPTNANFSPSTDTPDNQKTPTESVFLGSSSSVMTADSTPASDNCSSIMTNDSAQPLIPPVIPFPVVRCDQGRGRYGPFARRNANSDSFAMGSVQRT